MPSSWRRWPWRRRNYCTVWIARLHRASPSRGLRNLVSGENLPARPQGKEIPSLEHKAFGRGGCDYAQKPALQPVSPPDRGKKKKKKQAKRKKAVGEKGRPALGCRSHAATAVAVTCLSTIRPGWTKGGVGCHALFGGFSLLRNLPEEITMTVLLSLGHFDRNSRTTEIAPCDRPVTIGTVMSPPASGPQRLLIGTIEGFCQGKNWLTRENTN